MTDRPPSTREAVAVALHDALRQLDSDAQRHDSPALRRLAELRRASGRRFGDVPRADAELLDILRASIDARGPQRLDPELGRTLDDALTVASLVARSPRPAVLRRHPDGRGSLGRDLLKLHRKRDNGSVETLLHLLLGASRDQLPQHLRRAVALLAAERLPLDVAPLVHDLGAWNRADRNVQRRWTYDFYVPAAADRPEPDPDQPDGAPVENTDPTTPSTEQELA